MIQPRVMAVIKCGKCGSDVDEIAAVCPQCGGAIAEQGPRQVSNRRGLAAKNLVVAVVCILGISLVAIWLLNRKAVSGVAAGSKATETERVNPEEIKAKAEGGDVAAQTLLGKLHVKGEVVAQNYQEAAKWFRKAADQGYAPAQVALGELHEAGQGVAIDDAEAVAWYRRAAEQGYAPGEHNLALLYALGRGVPLDEVEAIKWYRKAAGQGDALSQYNLGIRCVRGRNLEADPIEAYKWLSLAGDQGLEDAISVRKDLKSRMTREQLNEAQRRVKEFVAKPTVAPAR